MVRSLPDAGGSVRLGYLRRGDGAYLGEARTAPRLDEYEVLLDEGNWGPAEWVAEGEDEWLDIAATGLACGRLADGTPLYATLRDREGDGEHPSEGRTRMDTSFFRKVLLAPVAAPDDAAEPDAAARPDAAGEVQPAGPAASVSALDLQAEVVEIANSGDAPLDLAGWRLRDEGAGKPYVFPAGTVVAAGASLRVRSGPGAATPAPGELVWKTSSVWNNRGDTAFLEDPAGTVVSSRKG
jgi:hypothetical protein